MKGYEKVKEIIKSELDDYPYFKYGELELIEEDEEVEFYQIEVKTLNEKVKILNFKYDRKEDKVYIEMSEDSYQIIEYFDWTIKYFWMALLEW